MVIMGSTAGPIAYENGGSYVAAKHAETAIAGTASDAPLCMTCGIKMRPSGSCYVREGCGSTSGCS